MAITQLSRLQLNQEFRDGERPSGDDFASAWTSFFHKAEDGFSVNVEGNLELGKGIIVKDTTTGQAGTLRFNGGQLQVHDGTSFKNVNTGAGGAFAPVTGGVAYAAGNVGIGTSSTLTYKLEVVLGNNTGTDQRVKVGNMVVHAGPSGTPGAYVAHTNMAGNVNGYALLQDGLGNTTVNGTTETALSLNNEKRVQLLTGGGIQLTTTSSANLVISGNTVIGSNALPVLNRNLTVNGTASKLVAGPFLGIASDSRVKKDVRPYKEGMQKLLALKPVVFKFNGKGQTPDDGKDYVGFVAQDVKAVLPELIIAHPAKLNESDTKDTEILNYDLGPVTFIMINAIKELAARLDKLEKPNTDEKRKPKSTTRAND